MKFFINHGSQKMFCRYKRHTEQETSNVVSCFSFTQNERRRTTMPSKAEFYRQMAEQVSTRLVGSWQEWTAFLTTAARLYKYPFHEQMMIYAQRPDATACAEYDLWNNRMGRYLNFLSFLTLNANCSHHLSPSGSS